MLPQNLFLQPKEDAEFDSQVKAYIPKEGEVRLITNRNV